MRDGSHSTAEDLLRDADAALNRAKERGRDRVEQFDSGVRARAIVRQRTEGDLRRGIERGELRPALPGDRVGRRPPRARLRGARALGAPRTRAARPGAVHPGRRGERPDRRARPFRAARGMPDGRRAGAGLREDLADVPDPRQRLAAPDQRPGDRRRARDHPQRDRNRPGAADARDHRVDADRARAEPSRGARQHRAARRRDRARRLRHRLLVAQLPPALPDLGTEGRPLVRDGARKRQRRRGDRRRDHAHGPRARSSA